MSINLKLIDPFNEIKKSGFLALSKEINKRFSKNLPRVLSKVKQLVSVALSSNETILSLSNYSPGGLASQLGLYPSQGPSASASIVAIISEDVQYKFQNFNYKFQGYIEFYIAHNSVEKLLSLPIGHVVYGKGDLHWLNWLLERGDSMIISGYQYNPKTGLGRSGGGNMITGSSFRIPPEFSGTPERNFISDSLFNKQFQSSLLDILERNL